MVNGGQRWSTMIQNQSARVKWRSTEVKGVRGSEEEVKYTIASNSQVNQKSTTVNENQYNQLIERVIKSKLLFY